jgi:hypothetical protein
LVQQGIFIGQPAGHSWVYSWPVVDANGFADVAAFGWECSYEMAQEIYMNNLQQYSTTAAIVDFAPVEIDNQILSAVFLINVCTLNKRPKTFRRLRCSSRGRRSLSVSPS